MYSVVRNRAPQPAVDSSTCPKLDTAGWTPQLGSKTVKSTAREEDFCGLLRACVLDFHRATADKELRIDMLRCYVRQGK